MHPLGLLVLLCQIFLVCSSHTRAVFASQWLGAKYLCKPSHAPLKHQDLTHNIAVFGFCLVRFNQDWLNGAFKAFQQRDKTLPKHKSLVTFAEP